MSHSHLRIALGLHSPQLGGSQICTIGLASELKKRGHDVVTFVVDADVKVSVLPIAEAAGVDVVTLPARRTLAAQARTIRALVDEHRADILHVHHEDQDLGPIAALATRRRPHCSPIVTNWMMANNRWLPPYAPLVVGFEALRTEARGIQRGPVFVLEPPVDTTSDVADDALASGFRSDLGIAADETLAVIVSRVDFYMKLDGILRSIDAVVAINEPKLRLVIVGDGQAMQTVRSRVQAANEQLGTDAVLAVGARHDPRPAYAAADIVLGMGGSALRGMSFGKPTIVLGTGEFALTFAPDHAGHFFEHGVFGHADEGRSPDAVLDALRPLVADEALRKRLGQWGRNLVEQRYSLQAGAERLEEMYRSAIDQPRSLAQRNVDVVYVRLFKIGHALPAGWRAGVRRKFSGSRSAAR